MNKEIFNVYEFVKIWEFEVKISFWKCIYEMIYKVEIEVIKDVWNEVECIIIE